jgi:hypothetical protein
VAKTLAQKQRQRELDQVRYQNDKVILNAQRSFNMRVQRFRLACEIKSSPCTDCRRRLPPWMLDFDHRDPSQKTFTISSLISRGVMSTQLQDELKKCDLVCAVCHAYRTRERAGLTTPEEQNFFQKWVSGSDSGLVG